MKILYTGCDGVPAFLLKSIATEITPNLTRILNSSIESSIYPSEWKRANVKAIWKSKGSKEDPKNYRPVSILPVLSRMFEKIISTQLYDFCEQHEVLPVEQYGFRRKSSCETALLAATNEWMKEIDRGKIVGALLVDLSKAFDSVPHNQLLQELLEINCSRDALMWFHSYLTNRWQRVCECNQTTPWNEVSRGVPQGSAQSPLLFNIYVRKIPEINSSQTIQFADDITHSEAGEKTEEIVRKLGDSFVKTKEFCDSHGLQINAEKTQFILFHAPGKRIPIDTEIVIADSSLKPLKQVKLLGITLDVGLTFGQHINSMVGNCKGLLSVLSKAAPMLPSDLLRTAYISLVRSRLQYCSAVWSSASATNRMRLDSL